MDKLDRPYILNTIAGKSLAFVPDGNPNGSALVPYSSLETIKKEVNRVFVERGWASLREAKAATKLSLETLSKLRNGSSTLNYDTVRRFAEAAGESTMRWMSLLNGLKEESSPLKVETTESASIQRPLDKNSIDLNPLTPPARSLVKMLVDQLTVEHNYQYGLLARDLLRPATLGSNTQSSSYKVLATAIQGPDYPGLLGDILGHIVGNVLNLKSDGAAGLSAHFMRIVVDKDLDPHHFATSLQSFLNQRRPDKGHKFIVAASEESQRVRPLLGVELALVDQAGVLNDVLDALYVDWIPVCVANTIPLVHTEGRATCLMSIEPKGDTSTMDRSKLMDILRNHPSVISADIVFDLPGSDV